MTERTRRHPVTTLLVVAPLTFGVLSLATEWAVSHDPAAQAAPAPAAPDPRLTALQAQVAFAANRLSSTEQTLRSVERTIHQGAARVAALRHANGLAAARSSGGAGMPPSAIPAIPAPPPPAVNTTTGAS